MFSIPELGQFEKGSRALSLQECATFEVRRRQAKAKRLTWIEGLEYTMSNHNCEFVFDVLIRSAVYRDNWRGNK